MRGGGVGGVGRRSEAQDKKTKWASGFPVTIYSRCRVASSQEIATGEIRDLGHGVVDKIVRHFSFYVVEYRLCRIRFGVSVGLATAIPEQLGSSLLRSLEFRFG